MDKLKRDTNRASGVGSICAIGLLILAVLRIVRPEAVSDNIFAAVAVLVIGIACFALGLTRALYLLRQEHTDSSEEKVQS
jgi:hypothetical protein